MTETDDAQRERVLALLRAYAMQVMMTPVGEALPPPPAEIAPLVERLLSIVTNRANGAHLPDPEG